MYSSEEKAVIYAAAVKGMNNRAGLAFLRGEGVLRRLTREEEAATDAAIAALERQGMFLVTCLSKDYPELLRNASDPPLLLYGMGNRELLSRRKFCIVGSRKTPKFAMEAGERIARELAEHFTIVTGLAEGGDSAAIEGALPSGSLISVLPCGLDTCYPAMHASKKETIARKGLILSENPPGKGAAKWSFHYRNRILAGLSEGVLVLSAAKSSGALITANRAVDYGRDVFALPYSIGIEQGEGCNELIRSGAMLVTSAEDILSFYGIETKKKEKPVVEGDEGRILQYLREKGESHVASLAEDLGMRIFEASAALSALEIKGLATKTGGNKYAAL